MGQKSKNAGKKQSKTCDKLATTKSVKTPSKHFKTVYVSPEEHTRCFNQGINPVEQYCVRGGQIQIEIGDY